MKPRLYFLLLCAALCAVAADTTKDGTGSGFVTISPDVWLNSPAYNRVNVANWIEVKGRDEKNAQAITVGGIYNKTFAPADTTITVNHEPTVTKRDDGTWVITFKEKTK